MRLGNPSGKNFVFPCRFALGFYYLWLHISSRDFSPRKRSILMKNNKKRPLEKYLAPTAEVVQVDVERGFAVSAPGYGDGGIW